jgi:hypothetical protein
VEVDVPQAMGVLQKILQRLEEYQAIRTNDPRGAYNDFAFAQELWPVEAEKENTAGREDASDDVAVSEEGNVTADEVKEK